MTQNTSTVNLVSRVRFVWALALLAASCGPADKKDDTPATQNPPGQETPASDDPSSENPGETAGGGETNSPGDGTEAVELGALTPAGATGYALNALSSSLILPSGEGLALANPDAAPILRLLADADNDGFDDDLIARTPNQGEDPPTQSQDLPRCDRHAEALATPTAHLDVTDPTYPKATLDCLLNHPSSADAVAGNIGMVNGIMCAAEAGIGEPLAFTEEGRDYGTVNIPITEA